MISIIAAMDTNRLIGADNDLPWHLPADLKRVKELTTGNAIILGRKNYESIGRPLPNRENIVISRNPEFQAPGCTVVHSIDDALAATEGMEIFIFGGANIYKQTLSIAKRMYLTHIHSTFEGDTYFPEFDESEWIETECEFHRADDRNFYDYSFSVLERK